MNNWLCDLLGVERRLGRATVVAPRSLRASEQGFSESGAHRRQVGPHSSLGTALGSATFRIWLVEWSGPQPARWDEVPQSGQVVELAETECLNTERAQAFLEAFNRAALQQRSRFWAVAVPVRVSLIGDLRPGETYVPK